MPDAGLSDSKTVLFGMQAP